MPRDETLGHLLDEAEAQRRQPTFLGLWKLIGGMALRPLRDPVGRILVSAILLIVLWGQDGRLPILSELWEEWRPYTNPAGRKELLGVPYGQELLAFAAGAVLLVAIPALLIRFWYGHRLRDYGLGLPEGRWVKLSAFSAVVLFAVSAPAFFFAAEDDRMQATYPLYRGDLDGWDFVVYELGYLLFFLAIEFVFRGYLLLGLYNAKDRDALPEAPGSPGPMLFGLYAIFIAMLSYTAWHLGKPTPELIGTLIWGPAAGAVVLLTRSIWPVVAVHWLLNVLLDAILLSKA